MGRMTIEPTYDRPVPATMIVHLANGEEFEAKAEDFAKFGYVDRNTVLADWRAFVEDSIASDLLSEDSVLNPFWLVLHQTLNNPGSLSDGSMGNTKADVQDLDRIIRQHKAAEAAF
jgi:hypothetical protein